MPKACYYIYGVLNLDLLDFRWNMRLKPRSHYICWWMFTSGGLRSHYICRWSSHRAGQVLRFLRQSNWDSNRLCRVFMLTTCNQSNHHLDRAVIGSEIVGLVGFVGLGMCWTTLITIFFRRHISSSQKDWVGLGSWIKTNLNDVSNVSRLG